MQCWGQEDWNLNNFHTQELNEAWQRLRQMALMRQERLFGAHEIQRFNRDADETIAWISEKDVVLGSDDYGRDLATVQTLQVWLYPSVFIFDLSILKLVIPPYTETWTWSRHPQSVITSTIRLR